MSPNMTVRLEHPERCIGCFTCVLACSVELFNVISATRTAVSVKPCSPGNLFVVSFCSGCDKPPCIAACEPQALGQDHEGKIELAKPSECKKCKTFDCAQACAIGALPIDPETNKPILCTQCGECAKFCPHEVITYRELER